MSLQEHIILMLNFIFYDLIWFCLCCGYNLECCSIFYGMKVEMNLFDMLGTENMCSSRAISMCQNNQNVHSHKLIFHSYLLFGKCNTGSDSFIHVCHSGRHSVQVPPKKPFITSILGLMLNCKFLP